MAWKVSGQLVESCTCNMLCPCWFGVKELMKMDQGHCAGVLLFRFDEGSADGVDLGSRTVALATDFPGPTMFDGNATVRLYIDSQASAEQRRAIESIMQGKQGGPMAVLAPLISKWLTTKTTSIRVSEKNGAISARVGTYGTIKSKGLTDEGGRPTTLRNAVFTTGLKMGTSQLAPSDSKWSDADMPREFETKSGVRSKIRWSGR